MNFSYMYSPEHLIFLACIPPARLNLNINVLRNDLWMSLSPIYFQMAGRQRAPLSHDIKSAEPSHSETVQWI